METLLDDLNTRRAIAELHRLASPAVFGKAVWGVTQFGQASAPAVLKASANLLGLLARTASDWRSAREERSNIDTTKVQNLIDARNAARVAKNFKESD